jgi:hypothetical protein
MLIVRTCALDIVHVNIADQVISYQELDPDPGFLYNLDPESDRTWTQGFFLKWTNFVVGKMFLYPCVQKQKSPSERTFNS